MIGLKFGKLTVLEKTKNKKNDTVYKCLCDCGNISYPTKWALTSGQTQGCGCVQRENTKKRFTTHGLTKHPLYKTWHNMRSRCNNPKATKYNLYGGRGITVCDEWQNDFLSFYNWAMANGYKKGLSIDRVNSDGNYEPNNCRWANYTQQSRNLKTNHKITYNGETYCLSEWAEKIGITSKCLSTRIERGWTIERALNTPTRQGGDAK